MRIVLIGAAAIMLTACGDGSAGVATDTGSGEDVALDGASDVADVADAVTDAVDAGDADAAPDTGDPSDGGEADSEPGDDARDADTDAHGAIDDADATDGADGSGDAAEDVVDVADGGADAGADTGPPPLFDMEAIADASTAACSFTNARTTLKDGVRLDVWNVSYHSWESIDGELVPITIRGYAARSVGARGLPGIVMMHGLGGHATESSATGLAAITGTFVIAPTGPGGGTEPANTSEGRPSSYDSGRRMFDTVPDPRGSWFWGHAVTAMRGVTCLESHPDVDADRLGMTGYSGGGVATIMAAGVDARIDAAVPLSGTGAWEVAMQSPNAWQWALLDTAELTMESPEWIALNTQLDPARLAPGARGAVFVVNGSTDEFFPLTAHLATYDALSGASLRRTAIAANLDHGCYSITGLEDAGSIEARADLHAAGGQRAFFAHVFGTDPDYAYFPAEPTVTLTPVGPATIAAAVVDGGGDRLEVESVKLWASTDSLVFVSADLEPTAGLWGATIPLAIDPATTVFYVEVVYRTQALIGRERFALASRPSIPAGHVPAIRSITSCTP